MKVLIIEDQVKIADSIKRGLSQSGYVAEAVYDGINGYDYASNEKYDLIILDLMLPGMDGSEICMRLRSENNPVPILMLTAKSELEDRITGLNLGADDYLTKPFSFEELLARIKALLRRPSDMLNVILQSDGLTVNTTSYEVIRNGVKINLSKKEFILLEYLMRNKGKVLSKDTIIENVWDMDSDVLPNTVEVYIGYLRTKIDKQFKNKPQLITTIRGFGYKLEDINV